MTEYKSIRLDIDTYNELNSLATKQGVGLGKAISLLVCGIGEVSEAELEKKDVGIEESEIRGWIQTSITEELAKLGMVPNHPQIPFTPTKGELNGTRTKGEVLADINALEARMEDELANCQDPETSRVIKRTYDEPLQILWAEFNALKEKKD